MHWRFFAAKRHIVSDINKETLNDTFAELIQIKNITDNRLNLVDLQLDDISAEFTTESIKKYISIR